MESTSCCCGVLNNTRHGGFFHFVSPTAKDNLVHLSFHLIRYFPQYQAHRTKQVQQLVVRHERMNEHGVLLSVRDLIGLTATDKRAPRCLETRPAFYRLQTKRSRIRPGLGRSSKFLANELLESLSPNASSDGLLQQVSEAQP